MADRVSAPEATPANDPPRALARAPGGISRNAKALLPAAKSSGAPRSRSPDANPARSRNLIAPIYITIVGGKQIPVLLLEKEKVAEGRMRIRSPSPSMGEGRGEGAMSSELPIF